MDATGAVLYVLSWILALIFLKAGLVKITRLFPKEHQQAAERFDLCATVCPTVLIGYKPPPYAYMVVLGAIETLCSIALFAPLLEVERGVYLIFTALMTLAIYTHGALRQYGKMVIPTCLFLTSVILHQTRTTLIV